MTRQPPKPAPLPSQMWVAVDEAANEADATLQERKLQEFKRRKDIEMQRRRKEREQRTARRASREAKRAAAPPATTVAKTIASAEPQPEEWHSHPTEEYPPRPAVKATRSKVKQRVPWVGGGEGPESTTSVDIVYGAHAADDGRFVAPSRVFVRCDI